MKITFDPEVDVIRIVFREVPIQECDEEKPGIILDYDANGGIIGVEILDASKQMLNPQSIEYTILSKPSNAPD